MYRPPEASHSRFDYPNEVRKTLTDAYTRARERLHLAHKRQKDYYDWRCPAFDFPLANQCGYGVLFSKKALLLFH